MTFKPIVSGPFTVLPRLSSRHRGAGFSSTELSTGDPRRAGPCQPPAFTWLLGLGIMLGAMGLAAAPAEKSERPSSSVELATRANAGDPWAQLNLGAAYDNGLGGFPLDPVLAVAWYRRAAESGLAEAQFNLAHCLATGNGTPRNDAEALEWMLRAAGQGLASAQFLAGVMLLEGIGGRGDRAQALPWLERAAANGNTDARTLLERLRRETVE